MARFSDRFGYSSWLRHLVVGEAPTYAEIGRAVDRTGQAVSAWAHAEVAPTDYRVHAPLAEFFAVPGDWLISNKGEPPRAELWAVWTKSRRAQPKELTLAALAIGKRGKAGSK